jgi:CRP-like cAMP-binding protein
MFSTQNARGLTVEARNNRLLAALPAGDLQRWGAYLELVSMPAGMFLCRSGGYPSYVYFPTTASVSMLHTTTGGVSVEIIAIGNEGMVGIPVIVGGAPASGDAVVRTAGHGFRLPSSLMESEFQGRPAVQRLLLRYTQALITHTAQAAICNKLHTLEQRLCRCFLSSLDGVNGAAINLTHENLSGMLGVRREGVTCTALKLQRAGLIDYSRGRVAVLDRRGLEALSCECYRAVKDEYDRFLPAASAAEAALSAPPGSARETSTSAWSVPGRVVNHAARTPSSAMAD